MFADRTHWDLKPNRLSEALVRRRASGERLLDLTASNPTECGFIYDQRAIASAFSNPNVLEYHPDPRGVGSAREAVHRYYARRKVELDLDQTFLTTSTSEAYSFVFRLLCNPGDEVLVPAPSYPLFDFLADMNDVRLKRYSLFYDHGWHMDVESVRRAITGETRAVILVNPNNPTGHYCKPAEIAALDEICSTGEIALIADEVFHDFYFGGPPPPNLAGHDQTMTFAMSGISKICGLPQMKLAWLAVSGPKKLKREALDRLEVISDTFLSMNAPVQLAAPILLEQAEAFQNQLMQRARKNLEMLDAKLSQHHSCSRLESEGGWYAVLRVPATRPDEELALELLERYGVYIHPGHFYEFQGDGHLIVSLITREADFAEGLEKVLQTF